MGLVNQTLQLHNRHSGERLQITRGVENGREVLYLEGCLPPRFTISRSAASQIRCRVAGSPPFGLDTLSTEALR